MIPLFPNFSPYSNKFNEEIMLATAHLPRYTETSMASMFCWDTEKQLAVSQLFGNIVLVVNQKRPGIVTILGTSEVDQSLEQLFSYCDTRGFARGLRLVSEPTIKAITKINKFIALPDADHHDYVINLASMSTIEGSALRNTRRKVKSCVTNYPNLEYIQLDLYNKTTISAILGILDGWTSRKRHLANPAEYKALKNLLEHQSNYNLIARGIVCNGTLIAFLIIELEKPWLHGHFWKANLDYSGVYQYLMHLCAIEFYAKGYLHMNIEEDLGIANLRTYKQLLDPTLLRKYSIVSAHATHQLPASQAPSTLNSAHQLSLSRVEKEEVYS